MIGHIAAVSEVRPVRGDVRVRKERPEIGFHFLVCRDTAGRERQTRRSHESPRKKLSPGYRWKMNRHNILLQSNPVGNKVNFET
jgi:hypothetical protein